MADNLRACWERAYERFWEAFDPCFTYKKTARRAREYVRGLMATLERKNGIAYQSLTVMVQRATTEGIESIKSGRNSIWRGEFFWK